MAVGVALLVALGGPVAVIVLVYWKRRRAAVVETDPAAPA